MRIDAHQHFWIFDSVRDSWINEQMSVIRKNFLPEDLSPILSANHIDGCVAVQADQSESETRFLLALTERNPFIKGVVGWVDFRADDIDDRIYWYSQFRQLKGFRHIVQAEPSGFLSDAKFKEGISALRDYGFTYDILIYPHQLKETINFIKDFPDQRFVIDHLAKPSIKDGKIDEWKIDIKLCASFENVSCKISGLVTEADWTNWKLKQFSPYIETALEAFGTKRLMFGSDWPVCLLAASYEQQLNLVENHLSQLSVSEKNQIMGENAIRFYNL